MLDIEQKEDSAEKLASVNGKPTRFYLFAQEFNSIVQKINEVYLGQNPNRITGLGTETVDGNQYTYQGYSWIINGADLDNIDNPSVIVIPSASVGFRRKDISVFNEFGNIVRVPGIETDGDIATTPDVPENTIYFRTYDVVGDVITSDETPPFVGIEYKSKRESDSYTYDNAGENVILPLPGEGQSHLIVENEDIVSIDGFDKSILILVRNGEYPYEGKDYLFENKSPNPVQLNHLTSAQIPSILPNEENVVVPSGGSVWFKFKGEKMAYIMKSWNDPVDLSTKADLVGGKVPAAQLPSSVFNVIEGHYNGTNFYTDSGFTNLITPESSKIYINIAVTPATQYRWSGSAYVQIGGGDTYNPSFWIVDRLVKNDSNNFTSAALNSGNFFGGSSPNTSSFKTMLGAGIMSGTNANGGGRYRLQPANAIRPTPGLSFYSCFYLANTTRDNVVKIGFYNTLENVTPITDGFWLQINGVNATLNTANGLITSQSPSSALNTSYLECLLEYVSPTEVKCKIKEILTGNVVFNQTLTTNIPYINKSFSCGLIATITTAGANQTICSVQELSFGIKPNFLNNF